MKATKLVKFNTGLQAGSKVEILSFFIAPTGKPVGSEYVTKFEPTPLDVGALKKKEESGF